MNRSSTNNYSNRHKRRLISEQVKTEGKSTGVFSEPNIPRIKLNPINHVQSLQSDTQLQPSNEAYQWQEPACEVGGIAILDEKSYLSENSESIFSSDDENINTVHDTQEFLSAWTIKHQIPRSALSDLLKHLQLHSCFSQIPKDARTLLKTPTTTDIKEIGEGKYVYFGLKKELTRILSKSHSSLPEEINLQFNIDGLPIHKSTSDQFWPILGCIINIDPREVFVIGIYSGKTKPLNLEVYLYDFVTELCDITDSGLMLNRLINVSVNAFVCDAPARSYLACIKNHTGYFGCGKCSTKGEWKNKVVFTETTAELRTDETFRTKVDTHHHTGISPLESVKFDIVKCFPYEYMHLVCLGVTRKLLNLWLRGSRSQYKLSATQAERISKKLLELVPYIGKDFARKPRSLRDLDRWKATEFRQFLLYTGPVVLKGILNDEYYDHFMCLHVAITILCSKKLYLELNQYADSLLKYWVNEFQRLYGSENVTYNVHGLIHLSSDAKYLGPLDLFSAFKFENKLGHLKSLLRKPNLHLQQIHRRIVEEENVSLLNKTIQTSKIKKSIDGHVAGTKAPHYQNTFIDQFELNCRDGNNACVLNDGSIIRVEKISTAVHGGHVVIVGRKFMKKCNFYTCPCDSTALGISIVSHLSTLLFWNVSKVVGKCLLFPVDDKFYLFPVLHTK